MQKIVGLTSIVLALLVLIAMLAFSEYDLSFSFGFDFSYLAWLSVVLVGLATALFTVSAIKSQWGSSGAFVGLIKAIVVVVVSFVAAFAYLVILVIAGYLRNGGHPM